MVYLLFTLYWMLVIATVFAALRWGDASARAVAFATALASALTPFARAVANTDFRSPLIGNFVLELALFVALSTIACFSRRFWPMTAAAVQLPAVLIHPAYALEPNIAKFSYALLQGLWGWLILLVVLGACLLDRLGRGTRTKLGPSGAETIH